VSVAPGVPYFIAISAGMHFADGWRNVENSGFLARYVLSQESGAEWGDGDFVGSYPRGRSVGGLGAGVPQYYNVRGELLVPTLDARAPIGAYQDVLLVTVYY
jgi:spore coat protein U-like protein